MLSFLQRLIIYRCFSMATLDSMMMELFSINGTKLVVTKCLLIKEHGLDYNLTHALLSRPFLYLTLMILKYLITIRYPNIYRHSYAAHSLRTPLHGFPVFCAILGGLARTSVFARFWELRFVARSTDHGKCLVM